MTIAQSPLARAVDNEYKRQKALAQFSNAFNPLFFFPLCPHCCVLVAPDHRQKTPATTKCLTQIAQNSTFVRVCSMCQKY